MSSPEIKTVTVLGERRLNRCLSCGTTENMGRRKYCSLECRQKLSHSLNIRTGLLKALNIRYATFYFTDPIIMLDVLPYGSIDIFSFIFPRVHYRRPVDDFCRMANLLGKAWWSERQRTNKRYLATRHVLEIASRRDGQVEPLRPFEIRKPARMAKSLTCLKLSRSDLDSSGLQQIIKSAYRRQAKIHHPDQGGNAAVFRRIQQAYEELLTWSENPTFIWQRGFPDKWFYDGHMNRWIQPTALRRKTL
jgi:DnaJ domain